MRQRRSKSKHASSTLQQLPIAQVFKAMASLSLLPKNAWDLNKQLRRDVRPMVTLRISKDTGAALLRSVLASKSVRHLIGEGGLPRVHDLPGSIREMTLIDVQSRLLVGALPAHLEAFSLTAFEGVSSSGLAACLNALPTSVRRLAFSGPSNGVIFSMADVKLPPQLEKLELNDVSELTVLPPSLTSIALQHCWLLPALQLPASLTSACLGWTFGEDTALPGRQARCMPALPQNLRTLGLSALDPLQPVAPLPPMLAHLKVHYTTYFTRHHGDNAFQPQPLAPLPQTLTTLEITEDDIHCFELQPILGCLPPHLEVLDVSQCINFNIALGQLPPTLTALHLGPRYTHALGPLPPSLTELQFHTSLGYYPTSLFNCPLGPLPTPLRMLDLSLCDLFDFPLGALPPALQELRLGDTFNQPLQPLPPALEVLALGNAFNQPLQRALPPALRTFEMGHSFNAPVELPETLTRLVTGDSHTHRLNLPQGLEKLRIGYMYTHLVPVLPLAHVRCPRSYPHAVVSQSIALWDYNSNADDNGAAYVGE